MPDCLLIFEPPDGGVAEHVRQLSLGLREHGWQPWVAGPASSLIYPELRAAGVPVAPLAFGRGYDRPRRDANALRGLLSLLRRKRFDLVHAHAAKAGALGRVAARLAGVPVVYSPHCLPFVGRRTAHGRALAAAVELALRPATDAMICVAEHERRLALKRRIVSPGAAHVVHNGTVPCDPSLEPDPELAAFARGGYVVGCLSVLRPQKALHVFVDAAPLILARAPDARLVVVGDGELRAQLIDRARAAGVGERLRFFGFRPPAARQLRTFDVFALPSAWEAFPIAILDALACGVPHVATAVGGVPEAVADGVTGLLCPPNDASALADAVVALLGDTPRRQRMALASRERYERLFRLDRAVTETVDVYGHALRARRARRSPRLNRLRRRAEYAA
jgi:glycosyltransferase involved in cell wall biosynthesis